MRAWATLEPAVGVGGKRLLGFLSPHVEKVLGGNGFQSIPDTGILKLSLRMAEGFTEACQAEGIT